MTPRVQESDKLYGERYFIPKEKQKMAKKQKNIPTTEPAPESPAAAEPVVADAAAQHTVTALRDPRAEAIICGRSFYVGTAAALNFLMLESLLGRASKQDLAELSARYRLRIEAHTSAEGDEILVLCENGVVDWHDGEHIVSTRLASAGENEA